MTQKGIEHWRDAANGHSTALVDYTEIGQVCVVQTHIRSRQEISKLEPEHYETRVFGDHYDGHLKRHASQLAATNYHKLAVTKCTYYRSDQSEPPWADDKEFSFEQPQQW